MNAPSDFASSQQVVPSYARIDVKQRVATRSKAALRLAILYFNDNLARILLKSMESGAKGTPLIRQYTDPGLSYLLNRNAEFAIFNRLGNLDFFLFPCYWNSSQC
jgi:hypothetical protein